MIYIQTKQSVFPKAIYIGDVAELRCSFTSDSVVVKGPASTQAFTQPLDLSVYDIKEISVQPVAAQQGEAGNYNLVIKFVPWRTGKLALPDYELQGVGTIHFEPIEILSLVEQQNISSLRSYSSPLLLPGTAYKIYAGIAVFIVLLVLLIRLIIKWRSVVFWFKNTKLKRRYARSKKNTIRALKALEEKASGGSSDSETCTMLQKIMREYLELRLDYPFTKTLTSEMSAAFNTATCGLADEKRYSAFENIISVFVRTDFIRFSDSADATFKSGELSEHINTLISAIDAIESEGGENA